jgi:radical SAM superfamily enzyme YgiQ (UPF0313 family)
MKVLLINPKQSISLLTFSEAKDITGCSGYMPNLALPTLAALAPEDIEILTCDENVSCIPYSGDWDLVGITGYITQRSRMFEIADEFRRRGRIVAIGGPYASLSPATVRPHADILFIGEAENTWPQFIADFRAGAWKQEYRAIEPVDIRMSPVPYIAGMSSDDYFMGVVQTSRGCPFECEFCDVIVYLGRKQRHKTPDRVVAELEQLYQNGYRRVFLSDDNFTANRRRAADIMSAVGEWNDTKSAPVSLVTQLSIDVARDQDAPLLDLCAAAGLKLAFIGIESPNPEALRDVRKHQNVRADLVSDIRKIQSRGIMVQAGMICGFDTDTTDSFRAQYDFIQETGVPMVALSLLSAPEGTPLEARLLKESRVTSEPLEDIYLHTNIVPKRMTAEELRCGTKWLLNKIYAPEAFLYRLERLADVLPEHHVRTGATREAAEVWQRITESFTRMGPEFASMPRQSIRWFRRKDIDGLAAALTFYKQVVSVLQRWQVWDEKLAQASAPDFSNAGVYVCAVQTS